jgi:hypothetical protein
MKQKKNQKTYAYKKFKNEFKLYRDTDKIFFKSTLELHTMLAYYSKLGLEPTIYIEAT